MNWKLRPAPSCSLRKAGQGIVTSTILYPNPFNDGVNILIPNEYDFENNWMQISVTDMQGRSLYNEKIPFDFVNQSINNFSKQLSEGIYDVNITASSGKNLVHQQIIKIK
jgi:hypothetical protein